MSRCIYCDKDFSMKGVAYHEKYCSKNPNRSSLPAKTDEWKKSQANKKGSNQYLKADELGVARPVMSNENREKLRQRNLKRSKEWHVENGKKISKTIQEKVLKGEWHTSLAKRMHYNYNGIDLHGKWELAFAKYLDKKGISWERPKNSFPYEFKNKLRQYTPDFYLIETKEYIEIKGYKTEKDSAKWDQFPLKLVVYQFKDLKKLLEKFPEISNLVK